MLCIFWAGIFFFFAELLQIFGLGTLGCNCWLSYQKHSASSEALSLVNNFHRQRRRRSRSGASPNLFLSPQQSSTAFNSSTTKIPLLFQCLQPRSQPSCSRQWHSLFPAQGSGHLDSLPARSPLWLLLHLRICLEWLSFYFIFSFLIGKWLKVLPDLFILLSVPLPFY